MHKTKELLSYITKFNQKVTVTSLMKLSYLIDVVSMKRNKEQVSKFEYKRYSHGPFDPKIYNYIKDLVAKGILIEEPEYNVSGDEYVTYRFNEESDISLDKIEDDKEIINDVLEGLKGYTARTLTDIAYKTKPMKKIGATPGGKEHWNKAIPLNI